MLFRSKTLHRASQIFRTLLVLHALQVTVGDRLDKNGAAFVFLLYSGIALDFLRCFFVLPVRLQNVPQGLLLRLPFDAV